MTVWETWAAGVLAGIEAPVGAVNIDTLWAWSNAETAPYDLMRWNNPLNTTEPWLGSRDSGAQPGAHDVKIYLTEQDGIDATVWTLIQEPYYPAIVANLRASLPRQQWGAYSTAGAELHLWGTGTNWLLATYGAAPITLASEDEMQKFLRAPDFTIYMVDATGKRGLLPGEWTAYFGATFTDVAAAVLQAIPDAIGAKPVDLSAKLDALAVAVNRIEGKLDAAGKAL